MAFAQWDQILFEVEFDFPFPWMRFPKTFSSSQFWKNGSKIIVKNTYAISKIIWLYCEWAQASLADVHLLIASVTASIVEYT